MSRLMRPLARLVLAGSFAVSFAVFATPAPRTFVASHGSDANPCTLSQPCRSFASAALQTADAGEIIVLDSAGYGPVTITQSITIVSPPGVYAGISAIPPNPTVGVTVNGAGIRVALRGLTINSHGAGVVFMQGAEVRVERCEIVAGAVIGNLTYVGAGITADSVPATIGVAATLYVRDTAIWTTGTGIFAAGTVRVTADNLRIAGSGSHGVDLFDGAQLSLAHAHVAGMQQAVWMENHLPSALTQAEIVSSTLLGGVDGIHMMSWTGGILALTLRDSFVSGWIGVGAYAGSGRIDVSIANTALRNAVFNGLEGTVGAGGTLDVQADGMEISGSSGSVRLSAASGGTATLSMTRSRIVGNQFGVQLVPDVGGTGIVAAAISDTLIADNTHYGIVCDDQIGASLILANTTVTRNESGVSVGTACVAKTRKNNTVSGNKLGDVTGTLTDLPGV